MVTRLILIRHGITRWNEEKRYCGFKDIGLSSKGRIQAARLCQRIKAVKIYRVYCSDKKRAVETAGIIFNGAKITQVKGLREINFGVFEGMRHKEIMKKYPQVYQKWLREPFKSRIPKAEDLDSFKKRVNRAIKKIARLNSGKTVAVVCHGGTIGVFITGILKAGNFWRHIPRAASITIVEYKKNKPKIKLFSCTKPLRKVR